MSLIDRSGRDQLIDRSIDDRFDPEEEVWMKAICIDCHHIWWLKIDWAVAIYFKRGGAVSPLPCPNCLNDKTTAMILERELTFHEREEIYRKISRFRRYCRGEAGD